MTFARAHLVGTAAAIAVLACCAGAPFSPAGDCKVGPLRIIELEDLRDCYCLGAHADQAVHLLGDAGVSSDWSTVTLWLHASDARLQLGENEIWPWARYERQGDQVESERWGLWLPHELLHHHEVVDLGYSAERTARHEGWADAGFDRLFNEYAAAVGPGRGGECP